MKPEILAMYLPQYHQIPENDAFWGKGFTDWVTVRRARPFFRGHQQPKIPLNGNYYDLSEKESVKWQALTARQYGVYGFGIYHYWFNNDKNLLTRPAELIRDNADIDIHYFFAWDNISWRRTWSNVSGNDWAPNSDAARPHEGNGILLEYVLGTEPDWEKHFIHLLPYFQDQRYVRQEGRPVMVIFHYSAEVQAMCDYWDQLARRHGFPGVCIIFRHSITYQLPKSASYFFYEPSASSWDRLHWKIYRRLMRQAGVSTGPHTFGYDAVWQRLLKTMCQHPEPELWPSAFVNYDDTPRRGKKGTIIKGSSCEKFGRYMTELLRTAQQQGKPYILLTAWNEWSEGAYLEPDTAAGYQYLEALRDAINTVSL